MKNLPDSDYEPVIGLEVHVQLETESKVFCGCSTVFGQPPNTQSCPVCLGLPGALPVLNQKALTYAIKVALALNCSISNFVKFDRKNYFYPDLPKNFQISQYDKPLSYNGYLNIKNQAFPKKICIKRVHLEEDAGKLLHDELQNVSLVDYNRSGMPLLEIVSEPDINSSDEAHVYLAMLKSILEYLQVSDCDMEKGSLRCDANISIRKKGDSKLGVKAELKNMNSFKAVKLALEYEIMRQKKLLESGEVISQETRLWDADKQITLSMRSKEEAHDYRYFPEPDLVPFIIDNTQIELIRKTLPELPYTRQERFQAIYGLSEYDATVLTQNKNTADYFEECTKIYNKPKIIANWILTELMNQMNQRKIENISQLKIAPQGLVELLQMIDSAVISGKIAKDVVVEMIETAKPASFIVKDKGLIQIQDADKIKDIINEVLKENSKVVEDYKKGKKNSFVFLVGQVMAKTKGKANPKLVNELLKEVLDNI